MPHPCAFCAAPPLSSSTFLVSRASPFLSPRSPTFRRHSPQKRARTHPPPHPHSHPHHRRVPLVCTFNKNRGKEAFMSQAAEALLSAGRFFQSPTGQVVVWGGLVWLVLTGRIGVLFDSFLLLFAVVTIVPVIAVLAFRWWVNRQLVQGTCPSCGSPVTGLKGQAFQCMTCGNTVQGEPRGDFSVKDPSSATIDIDAKEID